jgi:hypothetical protein
VKSLDQATIKTTGEVSLKPEQIVKLDPDAVVSLDESASVRLDGGDTDVKLDPNATVDVRGGVFRDVPRPSERQLVGTAPVNAPQAAIVTNFTVFKRVPHQKGAVMTGWVFGSNEQKEPSEQYCYYVEEVESGVDLKIDLAPNGVMLKQNRPSSRFSALEAASNCIWFGGGTTIRTL